MATLTKKESSNKDALPAHHLAPQESLILTSLKLMLMECLSSKASALRSRTLSEAWEEERANKNMSPPPMDQVERSYPKTSSSTKKSTDTEQIVR